MLRYRIRFHVLKSLIREAWSSEIRPSTAEMFRDVIFDDRTQTFKDRYERSLASQPERFDRESVRKWLNAKDVQTVIFNGRPKSAKKFLNIMFPMDGSRDLTPIVSGTPQSYVRR